MWHAWGRIEMHTGFWWGNLDKRHYCRKLVIGEREIRNWILKK
jgi:hypothetical protein